MSYYKELSLRRKIERKINGQCSRCGRELQESDGDCITCSACRIRARDYARKKSAERKARGLCRACSQPAINGMSTCEIHRQYMNKYMRDRRVLLGCFA